jgi:hypothetical protein
MRRCTGTTRRRRAGGCRRTRTTAGLDLSDPQSLEAYSPSEMRQVMLFVLAAAII